MAEKLKTADELAPVFGISRKTIYEWRRRGILPGYSVPYSRLIRFKESEVRKCWENRERRGFAHRKSAVATVTL